MSENERDKELYKEYQKGNEEAFNQLVLKYKEEIIRFLIRYTKSLPVAEDISQDVFVYSLLHKEQYNFQYPVRTYFYQIAKCRALNYIKREGKIVYFEDSEEYEKEMIQENENREDEQEMQRLLKKLPIDYQEVLYLTQWQGFKYRETAKILNKNMGQVKILMSRAKKKLRKLIEEEGDLNAWTKKNI